MFSRKLSFGFAKRSIITILWTALLLVLPLKNVSCAPLHATDTDASGSGWRYGRSTTRQLLTDMREGQGKPPPANTPGK